MSFLGPQTTTLFGNWVIAAVVSQDEAMPEQGWPLIQHDWCPNKNRDRATEREDTEEGHVMMEAEGGEMQLQAEEAEGGREPPKLQGAGRALPRAFRGSTVLTAP